LGALCTVARPVGYPLIPRDRRGLSINWGLRLSTLIDDSTELRLRKSLARRLIRIAWTPAGKSPIPAWACFPLLAWLWDASQRRAARLYKIPTFLQPPAAIVDYHSSPYLRYRPSSPTARLLADLSARQIARDRRAGTFVRLQKLKRSLFQIQSRRRPTTEHRKFSCQRCE
jgi:hypothetical protein